MNVATAAEMNSVGHALVAVDFSSNGFAGKTGAAFRVVRDTSVAVPRWGKFASASEIAAAMRELVLREPVECVWVVALDRQGETIGGGPVLVSIGGESESNCAESIVFRPLIVLGAVAFVLVHSHVSAWLVPSRADIERTRSLAASGRMIGIPMIDHVIVSSNQHEPRHFSFRTHLPEALGLPDMPMDGIG